MKKQHLILITAGIVLACLLVRSKKAIAGAEVIKPGDKGNDVYGLQNALSSMTGYKFSNMGAYDNSTLDAVRYYMQGTKALADAEKGYINRDFAMDLYLIQEKIK